MIPGRTLHRMASFICSPALLERVVEPAIADLQKECALSEGASALRRAKVLVVGHGAILKVISICAISMPPANDAERRELMGALAWSGVLVLLFAAFLAGPPLYDRSHVMVPSTIMSIACQAVPLAIPLGLAFGTAFGLRRRAGVTTAKFMLLGALAASVLSFVVLAWGIPATSDAFGFQFRLALAFASIALTSIVLALRTNRRGARGLAAFTACLAYWMLMFGGDLATRRGYLPVPVGAWLPNLALIATAIFVASSRQISVVKASD